MAPLVLSFLQILLFFLSSSHITAMVVYNVVDFGAKSDGRTDSSRPFLSAWAAACGSGNLATIHVPAGRFLVSQVVFEGPCKNIAIKFWIDGTIIAPSHYRSSNMWVAFDHVEGLSIYGGTLDGQGQSFWACKMAGRSCPEGATSLTISHSKNVVISNMMLMNSEAFHMAIYGCDGVTIQGVQITAPGDSPNTDGIHVQMSTGITITGATIKTGDDCISMGRGTTNVWIERIKCGPGHGISIGSLGKLPEEDGVQNVTVNRVVFMGTQNGFRVKTWGQPSTGFVNGVTFQHAFMQNVQNPIVIDQNYCPYNKNCPNQNSGIKINKVSYSDIQGSSATQVAVKFDCSPSNPCRGVTLQDIELTYLNQSAQSFCKHADGTTLGVVIPESCL